MVTQYSYLQLKIIYIIQTIFFNKFYLSYVSEKVESALQRYPADELRVFKNESDFKSQF